MVNTSDFSEFVIQREEELQTEVLGGLKNFAKKAALGAWMATQVATTMPNVNVPNPIGQEHGNSLERIENEKKNRKDMLKNKNRKNLGSPPPNSDDSLNLPSLPIR